MMTNTINEIKNSLEGINHRITETEERKSDLEYKILEITTTEQNKENPVSRRKEIINIRAEINEIEMKKSIAKINKSNSWLDRKSVG